MEVHDDGGNEMTEEYWEIVESFLRGEEKEEDNHDEKRASMIDRKSVV